MKPIHRHLLTGVAATALLSACGSRADDVPAPPVQTPAPPPVAMTLAQQIGAAFNTLFTASNEVEATEPSPSSVPPLDLTVEAIPG